MCQCAVFEMRGAPINENSAGTQSSLYKQEHCCKHTRHTQTTTHMQLNHIVM